MKKIKIDELSKVVMKELKEFANVERETIEREALKTAKETAEELKRISPKRTGDYAKDWSYKNVVRTSTKASSVVYNKKHYMLTHLLENGHAKRGGGRVEGKVHIATAEEQAIKNFEERLKKHL